MRIFVGGGYFVGVCIGMFIECTPFFRAEPSNLCGLLAFMFYGPCAAVLGLVTYIGICVTLSLTSKAKTDGSKMPREGTQPDETPREEN